MSEEKKKKNKIIGISIGIFIVLLIVISSTYAFWQITKKQADTNRVNTKCLSFEMEGGPGISIPKAMPTSDEDGLKLEGYTFTVTNNCSSDVDYLIGLEALEDTSNPNYIDAQYIKISLDNGISKKISSLSTIDNTVHENDTETIINTRKIATATLKGNGVNTHVLKMWLSSDAPITEQNKSFKSRVIITGGQGIENATLDKCFTIDENGEILAYNNADPECKEDVVIPSKINDIKVKTIDTNAFRGTSLKTAYYNRYNDNWVLVPSIEKESANVSMVGTITDISMADGMVPDYFITNTTDSEILALVEEEVANMEADLGKDIPVYTFGSEPDMQENQCKQHLKSYKTENGMESDFLGVEYKTKVNGITITGLDLSKAIYLDKIEARAFTNTPAGISSKEDFTSVPYSLTSLTFGKNDRPIEIGYAAFSRINVKNLTMYAAYYPTKLTSEVSADLATNNYSAGYLTYAQIENLTIKPSKTKTVLNLIKDDITEFDSYSSLYILLNAKNIVVEEGITAIDNMIFSGRDGVIDFTGESLTLPNSLVSIGENAFHNVPFNNVTIGSGITSIGNNAFQGMNASQTITIKKADSTGITLGDNWSDGATVKYAP